MKFKTIIAESSKKFYAFVSTIGRYSLVWTARRILSLKITLLATVSTGLLGWTYERENE